MIKVKFNDNWIYNKGSGLQLSDMMKMGDGTPVNLPHDAVINEPHDLDGPNKYKTGYYPSFNCNYAKTFFVPAEDKGKTVVFEFEGVYMNCSVFINNSFAGKNANGYSGFCIDASDYLNYGKNNKITVVVKNESQNSRWYSGGGIYRDVNIIKANSLHIVADGVKIKTESTDGGMAVLHIHSRIENKSYERKSFYLKNDVLDESGKIVASDIAKATVLSGESISLTQRVCVKKPKLWNVDTPVLYECKSQIIQENSVVDENRTNFGIRILSLDRERGFRINGKRVLLRGGCIHHDNGIIGAVSLPHAEVRKIQKLKEAGYNAVRSAHNPLGRAALDACDRLGMLVMDELTDSWNRTKVDFDYGQNFAECWEQDVVSMVNKDYNHPSVIMYSVGNEIPEAGNSIDSAWGLKISNKIKEIDDTRYTLNSVNHILAMMNIDSGEGSGGMSSVIGAGGSAGKEAKPMDINAFMNSREEMMNKMKVMPIAGTITEETFSYVDIAGYNYATERYETDLAAHPNRIIVGSETYLCDLATNWEYVKNTPAILGDFVWTAIDYLGEAGIGCVQYDAADTDDVYSSGYCLTAGCGDLDLIGDRKTSSLWRETVWGLTDKPYITVLNPTKYGQKCNGTKWSWTDSIASWSYKGYEDKPVEVEVYADADEVELLINNKSYGRKKIGEEKKYLAKFECIYEPGKIEAVSYKVGKEYARNSLVSAGSDIMMKAVLDRDTIGQNDLAYIDICFADKNGIVDVLNNSKVKIEVEGAGVLQGFGSADSFSRENFYDTERTAYQGRLLAAVRSLYSAGEIKVTVTSEGNAPVNLLIKVTNRV